MAIDIIQKLFGSKSKGVTVEGKWEQIEALMPSDDGTLSAQAARKAIEVLLGRPMTDPGTISSEIIADCLMLIELLYKYNDDLTAFEQSGGSWYFGVKGKGGTIGPFNSRADALAQIEAIGADPYRMDIRIIVNTPTAPIANSAVRQSSITLATQEPEGEFCIQCGGVVPEEDRMQTACNGIVHSGCKDDHEMDCTPCYNSA